MELYKEHNVNPFGSCLPLLIQAPVFIALNAVLRYHIHPTGDQAFLGINNIFVKLNELTPAAEYTLIALYVGLDARLDASVLVRHRPPAEVHAGRDADRVRALRRCNFTTGVMIYWITSNFWTIGQQGMIKRTMGHRFPQPAPKGGSSGKGRRQGGRQGRRSSGKGAEKGGGGKPAAASRSARRAAPRGRAGSGRRTSQQPGRRSGQRRGGRKR